MNHISVFLFIIASFCAVLLIYKAIQVPKKNKTIRFFLIYMLLLFLGLIFDLFYHYFSINIEANYLGKTAVFLIDRISGGILTATETVVFLYLIHSIYKTRINNNLIIVLSSVFGIFIFGYFSVYFGLNYIYAFDTSTVINYSINEGSRIFLVFYLVRILLINKNHENNNLIFAQNRISLFYIIIFSTLVLGDSLHFFINYNHEAYYLTSSIYYLIFLALPVIYFNKYVKMLNLSYEKIDISLSLKHTQILNDYNITPREQEVINLIVDGKTNREISNMLFISYQTVKDHNYRIFRKFNVNTRVKLIQSLLNVKMSA